MTLSATRLVWSCVAALATAGCCACGRAEGDSPDPAAGRRRPWTTSRITGRPEPPPPYRVARVFPRVSFQRTTLIEYQPLLDRFFVGEQAGKIYALPKDREGDAPTVFFDCAESLARLNRDRADGEKLELEALYGMAFDPDFATNRFCYVCYVVRRGGRSGGQFADGTRVVRLKLREALEPSCDPDSEQLVISWLQGGHNGGCLRFGPDGCLYVSTGDGSAAFPPDGRASGQDLSTLLAKVLRIDVRGAAAGRAYAIPPDNPFVQDSSARGEIWAYGLRNPWKMSFDRRTGDLWVGDVGWELWELIYNVRRGENYGWSIVEGPQPVNAGWKAGPTPIMPPAMAIPHTEAASITGGFVYRGRKFPELVGSYVFGDWETRRIWAAEASAGGLGERRELVDPVVRVVDFAEDAQGELYLLDHDDGHIYVFEPNERAAAGHAFPESLSATGLFTAVKDLAVAPGVVPFSINAEQWCDSAVADRLIAVPGSAAIRVRPRPTAVPGSQFRRSADFPKDTVLAKTLSLEMEVGNPASLRPVETQILHHDGREWRGYTYAWNDEQTDATLVDRDGAERVFEIRDAAAAGGRRTKNWHFSARSECLRCHNPWSEHTLAFNLPQLNRTVTSSGTAVNQLAAFHAMGLLESDTAPDANARPGGADFLADPASIPRLTGPFDPSAELEPRARAYLHVNCGHCHRFNGGGSARIYLTADTRLSDTLTVGVPPALGAFGIGDAALIAPGDPYRSILFFRLSKTGPGHMPHLGTREVDDRGVALVHDWIQQIPVRFTDSVTLERLVELDETRWLEKERESRLADERRAATNSARRHNRAAPGDEDREAAKDEVDRRNAEAAAVRGESRRKIVADLMSAPASALFTADAVRRGRLPPGIRSVVLDAARGAAIDPAIRDLFEPFLPESERTQRLGNSFDPAALLALPGDADRGGRLFRESTVVQCRNCHRVGGIGTELGPPLNAIGRKYDRRKLLESIVYPSKDVDPVYATWVVETTSGKVLTGLLVERGDAEIALLDPQNRRHVIPRGEVEQLVQQRTSLMPELQLQNFTEQQAADLLAFLATLKADPAASAPPRAGQPVPRAAGE